MTTALLKACSISLFCALAVAACSGDTSSGPDVTEAPRVVLFAGDEPYQVDLPTLAAPCAEAVQPALDVVAGNDHVADLDLDEMTVFLRASALASDRCAESDAVVVATELAAWRNAVPPTFDRDIPAVLSRRCADALVALRVELAEASSDAAGQRFTAAAAAVTELLEPPPPSDPRPTPVGGLDPEMDDVEAPPEPECTPAEALLFRTAEIDPPLRRAGVLPTSSDSTAPGATSTSLAVVEPVDGKADVSKGCSAQLGVARDALRDAAGSEASEALRDRVAAALRSVDGCTDDELAEFQAVEVAPALGLTALTPN